MAKLRVLIVENEPLIRLQVTETLTILGHEPVGWAATVSTAIEEAERLRPDVVLMDIQLDAGGDGTEAARVIRDRFNIPSLYMTGGVDPDKRQRAMSAQPIGYLQKPFMPSALQVVLVNAFPDPGPVIIASNLREVATAAARLLTPKVLAAPTSETTKPQAASTPKAKNSEPDAVD